MTKAAEKARSIAVAIVDALRGYTLEFSAQPAQHEHDYDVAESAARAELRDVYVPCGKLDPIHVARAWYAGKYACDEAAVMAGRDDSRPFLSGAIEGARAMQIEMSGAAIPDAFAIHKDAWRQAIVTCHMLAEGNAEQSARWAHELRCFDAAWLVFGVAGGDVAVRQRNSADTWAAMTAMRNTINEVVPMPSIESDLLQGPENSVFCAEVAKAVTSAVEAKNDEIGKLRSLLSEARHKGLIYWEPNTSRGFAQQADMFARIDAVLESPPERSALDYFPGEAGK